MRQSGVCVTRYLTLLPHYKIRAVAWRAKPASLQRFVRLFRSAWKRIPACDRKRLIAHWRSSEHCPVDITSGHFSTLAQADAVAAYQPTQNTLCFWTPILDALPDKHAETLIAHEVAHVYLIVVGDRSHTAPRAELQELFGNDYTDDDEELAKEQAEYWADECAKYWGFPVDRWREYMRNHPELPKSTDTAQSQ